MFFVKTELYTYVVVDYTSHEGKVHPVKYENIV